MILVLHANTVQIFVQHAKKGFNSIKIKLVQYARQITDFILKIINVQNVINIALHALKISAQLADKVIFQQQAKNVLNVIKTGNSKKMINAKTVILHVQIVMELKKLIAHNVKNLYFYLKTMSVQHAIKAGNKRQVLNVYSAIHLAQLAMKFKIRNVQHANLVIN
ncbi:hypothetical protein TTHERM_000097830 (macronuclear) [Tetrahymena thermophila SB210]|uniref:Uncharacterized protein n=1 Tax=Tetrahymena thermophila (strain SB210) TaxID=312017 RepID=W7XF25_TETTS|nr:hypothetical protein TTHERM_000097830 [Tetrahymena thermophila SB210]EWS75383.1 hypothetical protein TTHERM_000097830 [Tetrahymena thermophila SB210]|eukprot:XP_012652057.1 hypothetical protein TTHERM_000097830 [Tetrahymena thermophila SB210]